MKEFKKIAQRVARRYLLEGKSILPGDGEESVYPTKIPVSGFGSFREEKGDGEGLPDSFDTIEEDQEKIKDPMEDPHDIEVKPHYVMNIPNIPEDVKR